ncbi:unnamed protein product [Mesocestoides corti]|uniref:Small monomeric GTPase n=2 Tax=Mesocestoides corti TaxID=53468 RepID=A0A0R3ULR2_MESCO|nr:unnamed protein product [Mesocestoides corti]
MTPAELQFPADHHLMGYDDSSSAVKEEKRGISKPTCRIVFLGAAKVGKTSIIRQFLKGSFESKYTPTVDDVYFSKFIVHGCLVNVEFMDTSGSYDFPAMVRLCVAKADAFVIVFAHDNMESLIIAGRYLDQIKLERENYTPFVSNSQACGSSDPITSSPPLVVVCNKSDLPSSMSKVSEGAVMEWLLKRGLKPSQFVYTSARTNECITDIFKSLWSQNEATHSITFSSCEEERRGSVAVTVQEGGSIRPSDSSPTEKTMTSPAYEMLNKGTSFFRSSFKMKRRNSSRQRKTKSDFIRLDCTIS